VQQGKLKLLWREQWRRSIGTPECLINMFHGRHTYSYFRLVQRK
jgi:hypothetical protein